MKISIVLATYNGEKYIERQIRSIVHQTLLPDEIVITDDNSNDNTIKIVEKYVEKYPEINWVFTKNPKQGFVNNFFNGIYKSSGDIIFLSDQDDEWKENKIKIYSEIFQEKKEISLIHSDINITNLTGQTIRKNTQSYSNGVSKMDIKTFLNKPNYPGMSIAFRRNLVEKNKGFISKNFSSIATHDFLLVMFSVFDNGFYTLGESYADRTFTGENVALRANSTSKFNRIDRIHSANTYINQYKLILNYIQYYDLKEFLPYEDFITCLLDAQKQRLRFLKASTVIEGVKLLTKVKYLPSVKSVIADFLSK